MADTLIFNNSFTSLRNGGLVFRNLPDSTGAERPNRAPIGSKLTSDQIDDNFRKLRDAGVIVENNIGDINSEIENITTSLIPSLQTSISTLNSSISSINQNLLPSKNGVAINNVLAITASNVANWRRINQIPLNQVLNIETASGINNPIIGLNGSGQPDWIPLPNNIPIGAIMLWGAGTIPNGWAECNGQTVKGFTTPNLRGRFVVGAGTSDITYNLNATGGTSTVTLTLDQIPAHSHTIPGRTGGGPTGGIDFPSSTVSNVSTSSAGGGQAHENRPPFYVLRYIAYVG